MALPTAGSPAIQANTNAAIPATSPASMPRRSSLPTTMRTARLVAGEAEQVPPVVQELVHVRTRDHRRGALVAGDEVDEQQQEEAEHGPRPEPPHRDGSGQGARAGLRKGDRRWESVLHENLLRDDASRPDGAAMASLLAPGSRPFAGLPNLRSVAPSGEWLPGHSGATAPDLHRLPHTNALSAVS